MSRKNYYLFAALVCMVAMPLLAHYLLTKTSLLALVKQQRTNILHFVASHYLLSVALFITLYTLITALSIPEAALLTTASGFLFGTIQGTLYVIIAGTMGAICAFILIRFFIGKQIQQQYAPQLVRFNTAFERQGAWYLMLVHLVPGIPFVLINMLAALTRVPIITFIWTTLIGLAPGTFFYTFVGKQIRTCNGQKLCNNHYWFAIVAVCVCACIVRLLVIKIMRSYKMDK